jgi:hypothetical protein
MTRVSVMLRFEMINGSINVYRERTYKQGQKDKSKVTKKNKDIKGVFGREPLIFFILV